MATQSTSIKDRVIKIVCDQLSSVPEKIDLNTSFINDLGADSLDTVELVMELEDEFGVSIPDEDAETITTVGAAIDYITNKGEAGGGESESGSDEQDSAPEVETKA